MKLLRLQEPSLVRLRRDLCSYHPIVLGCKGICLYRYMSKFHAISVMQSDTGNKTTWHAGRSLWSPCRRSNPVSKSSWKDPSSDDTPANCAGRKPGTSKEEIGARIAASRERRASLPPPLRCPACSIGVGTALSMAKHISLCCPDLTVGDSSRSWVTLGATLGADGRGRETGHLRMLAEDLLKEAGRREHEAREEVIKITFRCLGSFLALGVYDILDSLCLSP